MYTDPGDESVWIYHRWLIGDGIVLPKSQYPPAYLFAGDDAVLIQREIGSIQELLDEQPDSKCRGPLQSSYLI